MVSDEFTEVRHASPITTKHIRSRASLSLATVLRGALGCFVVSLLLHVFASVGYTKSLTEYHLRLRETITALDTMGQHDESESEVDRAARISQTIGTVRSALPETDTVELGEATIAVDNSWLHRELDTYETKESDRAAVLARVLERLRALEERVAEFDKGGRATGNKSESGRKLAEILSRPEYARNAKDQSALTRLLRDLWKWLQQFLPQRKPQTAGGAGWITLLAQFLVILLALGVIAYVLKTFAPRLFRGRRPGKKAKRGPRIVLGETLAPDESAGDILADAEALARRGELRAAIRKAYIALLVELGERKILSLAQHKTNRDYLRAVREVEPLHTNVKQLTDSFERHWYGFALATDADWIAFRAGYKQALQELK